jgi:hypothetical protein
MWDDNVTDVDALPDIGDSASADPRVLVAVITRPRDWELVQREGWYRIPLSRAPRRLAAAYLAFYHTAAFPELRWTIAHYAPILRYDVLRRIELLPDEPQHPRAQERYYRLTLGPLVVLSRPIISRRLRRVAFFGTTLAHLLSAREINDLWEHDTAYNGVRQAFQTRESAAQRSYRAHTTITQHPLEG